MMVIVFYRFRGQKASVSKLDVNGNVTIGASYAAVNVVPMAGGAAGTAILAATAGKWVLLVSNGTNWLTQMGN